MGYVLWKCLLIVVGVVGGWMCIICVRRIGYWGLGVVGMLLGICLYFVVWWSVGYCVIFWWLMWNFFVGVKMW